MALLKGLVLDQKESMYQKPSCVCVLLRKQSMNSILPQIGHTIPPCPTASSPPPSQKCNVVLCMQVYARQVRCLFCGCEGPQLEGHLVSCCAGRQQQPEMCEEDLSCRQYMPVSSQSRYLCTCLVTVSDTQMSCFCVTDSAMASANMLFGIWITVALLMCSFTGLQRAQ